MLRFLTILMLVALPLSTHAEEIVVLKADFDADSVGGAPDLSLPGGPDGDHMTISTRPSGSSFTVQGASGPLMDQPLLANRLSGPGGFGASFRSPESAYPSQQLVVRWCSSPLTSIPATFFVLRGPQGAIHGAVNYRGLNLTINQAIGSHNEINVGTATIGESLCFEWYVNRTTGVQSLYIDGVLVMDQLQTNFGLGSGVDVIAFQYEPSSQSAFQFAIDDVEVGVLDSPTPVDASTWGQIKSSYR